jgi:hypothetical protein
MCFSSYYHHKYNYMILSTKIQQETVYIFFLKITRNCIIMYCGSRKGSLANSCLITFVVLGGSKCSTWTVEHAFQKKLHEVFHRRDVTFCVLPLSLKAWRSGVYPTDFEGSKLTMQPLLFGERFCTKTDSVSNLTGQEHRSNRCMQRCGENLRSPPREGPVGGGAPRVALMSARLLIMSLIIVETNKESMSLESVGGTRKIRNTTLTQVTVINTFNSTVRAQRDWNSPYK